MSATRVLLVTRNLPPLLGGMERLNLQLAMALAERAETHVLGPMGAEAYLPPTVTLHAVPLRPLPRFLASAFARTMALALRLRPEWIVAGSALTAPMALAAARVSGARAAAYAHGLDLAVPHPVYRALWHPAIRRLDRLVANSGYTAGLARALGVPDGRLAIVHPGVDLPPPDPQARARFRVRHGLGERPVLLSVGRLTARKGLREFVREVLPRVVARRPDAVLVVVGDVPKDALHAQAQMPEAILEDARRLGRDRNLRFTGPLVGPALDEAWYAADVHVFPVREIPGDPEGFGMVAIEAAAHGVPTVAYATGGVPDAVAHGQSGYLVPPGDAAAFADAVLRLLDAPLDEAGIRAFAKGFAWEVFGERVRQVLQTTPLPVGGDR
ncbi:glycosyltransferase family 4 protein [Tepidiphilus sp. J10]|uniref:glycosyltransferase family 4 protein n=1 Tax=Tepidiphilus sp. J10 TaxID=2502185 RepID=UPI00115CCB3D|nr:glycosyltransferase family 4 protein [Tepidiphilus sp. J10]